VAEGQEAESPGSGLFWNRAILSCTFVLTSAFKLATHGRDAESVRQRSLLCFSQRWGLHRRRHFRNQTL